MIYKVELFNLNGKLKRHSIKTIIFGELKAGKSVLNYCDLLAAQNDLTCYDLSEYEPILKRWDFIAAAAFLPH